MKKLLVALPALFALQGCGGSSSEDDVVITPDPDPIPQTRPSNQQCLAKDAPVLSSNVKFEQVYNNLEVDIPIQIYRMPGNSDDWFVIDRLGYVYKFADNNNVSDKTLILDIKDKVISSYSEMGLLGMAFHPDFEQNNKVYLYYVFNNEQGERSTTISEFTYDLQADQLVDEVQLLVVRQFTQNHQGGHLEFGPDGQLYFAYGDDAKSATAQELDKLYGKMIRIHVPGNGTYSIPEDNPYVGVEGARGEIWASGFRHPWRYSIDQETGDIWVGDVGANNIEEVNQVVKGGNYGWPYKEGTVCSLAEGCGGYPDIIDPVLEFSHEAGWGAIIGGAVYRGDAIPGLKGKYIFADFSQFSRILSLDYDENSAPFGNPLFEGKLASGGGIHSFTLDHDGELYVIHFKGIFKMVPDENAGSQTVDFPQTLSETGCFEVKNNALEPTDVAFPFEVASSLYTDGADKRRWMALPDGKSIEVTDSGDFIFPVGSVLIKEFALGGKKIETRLLMKNDTNQWNGYTYEWNVDQTEANLLPAGKTVLTEGINYKIPNRIQCQNCHNDSVNGAIGPEFRQLNFDHTYDDGTTQNQIDYLAKLEIIQEADLARKEDLPAYPDYHLAEFDDKTKLDSFFHSNCAYCHNPTGPARGSIDFTYQALPYWNTCNKNPEISTLGIDGAKLIAAGEPEKSIVYKRLNTTELEMMPPIGRTTVQDDMVSVLHSFITNTDCK